MIPRLMPIILDHTFELIFGILTLHSIAVWHVDLGYHSLLAGLLVFSWMNICGLCAETSFGLLFGRRVFPKLGVVEVLLIDNSWHSFETAVIEAIVDETVGQVDFSLRVFKSGIMAFSFCF